MVAGAGGAGKAPAETRSGSQQREAGVSRRPFLENCADIRQAAQLLAGFGPKEIMITHRNGVLVYESGKFCEAGFFPKKLVGRSGRGDTCIAAYVSSRLSASPAEATVWAAAVASLKMEAEGPFRKDVHAVETLVRNTYGG